VFTAVTATIHGHVHNIAVLLAGHNYDNFVFQIIIDAQYTAVCMVVYTAVYTGRVYTAVYVYGPCTRPCVYMAATRPCIWPVLRRVHGCVHVYTACTRPWKRPLYTAVYTAMPCTRYSRVHGHAVYTAMPCTRTRSVYTAV